MIRIITIAREYGSGGAEVGRQVAKSLGWEFIDKSLIDRIARLAHVPADVASEYDERPESWLERLTVGFRVAGTEGYASPGHLDIVDANSMHALTEHVIRTAASIGNCVIVGRGSQCILNGRDDVLHAFVYASIEERTRRLTARHPGEFNLRDKMADVDRERAKYVRQYYGCVWDDICLYDLCVNSAIGISSTADIVVQAASRFVKVPGKSKAAASV